MPYALAIVLYPCLKMLVDSLPYHYQFCLHHSNADFGLIDLEKGINGIIEINEIILKP